MKLEPIRDKKDIRLGDGHARVRGRVPTGSELEAETKREVERIGDLQQVLYADASRALLVVLQGRDASGKDGTIKKVFADVNPQGCDVTSFKAPTELEQRHDFLWRVHAAVPPRRMIGVFNRSHYEDVLVPRVHGDLTKKQWTARYEDINAFERMLHENGVVILKFMLHVSRDEQRRRLVERLRDETKNWKFREGDLDDRERWDDYTKAYRSALAHTSTTWAPWYVVPADDKDVRDLLIARTVADAMDELGLEYPKADPSIVGLEIE
jgi:PPK2 family polyphosphate:nucleotide phosphotransferase